MEIPMNPIFRKLVSDPTESLLTPEMKSRLTPQSLKAMSIFGISYAIIVIGSLTWTCIFVALPHLYGDSPEALQKMMIVSWFFVLNVVLNFILVATNRSFFKPQSHDQAVNGVQPLLPDNRWNYCLDCKAVAPPQAHHCALCGHCIMKRDHHCFFTGCCVGYDNQRYFLMFCLHAALGASFGIHILLDYISDVYEADLHLRFYDYLFPWTLLEWMFGYVTFGFLCHMLLLYLALASALGAGGIFCYQTFLISLGMTSFEFWKGKKPVSFRRRNEKFRAVFGPLWMLNIIVPMPFLKTPAYHVEKTV